MGAKTTAREDKAGNEYPAVTTAKTKGKKNYKWIARTMEY
jgi:hypothetical protein